MTKSASPYRKVFTCVSDVTRQKSNLAVFIRNILYTLNTSHSLTIPINHVIEIKIHYHSSYNVEQITTYLQNLDFMFLRSHRIAPQTSQLSAKCLQLDVQDCRNSFNVHRSTLRSRRHASSLSFRLATQKFIISGLRGAEDLGFGPPATTRLLC